MGFDRRVLAGGVAACYAAVIIGFGHSQSLSPLLLVGSAAVFTAVIVWLLGRQRGALVALIVAAALNRYSGELGGATFKPEHIVAPLVALALLPDWRLLLRRLDIVSGLLLVWLAWSVIPGLLNAPDAGNSTRLWAMLVLVSFGYFATVTTVRTAGRARTIVRAWLLVGIAVGLFGICEHVLYQAFDINLGIQVNPVTGDPTIPGTFYEANLFGSATMMLALTGIALLAFATRMTWLACAAAAVGTLATQISFTRTAWIAFVFGLLVIVLVRLIYSPRREQAASSHVETTHKLPAYAPFATYVVVALVGTLLLWGPFASNPGQMVNPELFPTATPLPVGVATPTAVPTLSALVVGTPVTAQAWTPVIREADIAGRVTSIGDASDASLRLRLRFIRAALRDWKEHPFVGLGIGSFGQKYVSTANDRAWLSMFAVRLLHDGGIIGVVLFTVPVLLLAWRALQLLRRPRGTETERIALALAIATLAMFFAFLATEGLQLAWYWCAFGLFGACLNIALRERPVRIS